MRTGMEAVYRLVALLAEGVDRNSSQNATMLSTHVALLAEGVDRNLAGMEVQERLTEGRPPRGGRG